MERGDRFEDVREVRDHPVARPDPRRAQAGREAPRQVVELTPGRLFERPELRGVSQGNLIVAAVAEHVLDVVEPRSGEPLGSRHGA
jgi:hypothetical protein